MKFTVGDATIDMTPISPREKRPILRDNPEAFFVPRRMIYWWTCGEPGSGTPDPRPAHFTPDVDFVYVDWWMHGQSLSVYGPALNTRRATSQADAALGVSQKAFEKYLRGLYGPRRRRRIAIDYKTLLDPWKDSHDVAIRVEEQYLRWRADVTRGGRLQTTFYVQFPVSVTFTSDAVAACDPGGDPKVGDGGFARMRWRQNAWGAGMAREWQRRVREITAKLGPGQDAMDDLAPLELGGFEQVEGPAADPEAKVPKKKDE